MRSYYPGITVFKVAGALAVVLAHAVLINHVPMELVGLLFFVVPLFYLISGFLVGRAWSRVTDPDAYTKKYLLRIGAVYVVFAMAYTGAEIASLILTTGFSADGLPHLVNRVVYDLVMGPAPYLWFIAPLLFGVALTYWLMKRSLVRKAGPVIAAGFIISVVLGGTLRTALLAVPGFASFASRKWVQYATPALVQYVGYGVTFVMMGFVIQRYPGAFSWLKGGPLIFAGVVLLGVETVLLSMGPGWDRFDRPLCFSVIPLALVMFRLLLRWEQEGTPSSHKFWNLFAGLTYFLHMPLLQIQRYVFGLPAVARNPAQDVPVFLLVVVECFLISLLVGDSLRTWRRPSSSRPLDTADDPPGRLDAGALTGVRLGARRQDTSPR